MTSSNTSWESRLLASQVTLAWIWILGPAAAWIVDFSRNRHNDYLIYKNVFWNLLDGRNLYLPYPERYGDSNHYGPFFSLVFAPFALLPDGVGGLLWNLAISGLFWLAVGRLGLALERRLLMLALCTLELLNASYSNQFNPAIASLLLLTFAGVEEGRERLAPLWILIGAFVKLYSVVGLVLFFFARNRKAFVAGCVAWTVVLVVLPMTISSPSFVLQSYVDWYTSLVEKNGLNVALHTSQDISIMGLVRRAVGRPIANGWFLLFGIPLVLAPLLRTGQYRHRQFRLLVLASLLMFVVLFSSGSESTTYVICVTGAALWLVDQDEPFRPRNVLLMAGMLLAGLAPTDLLSVPVRLVTNAYALKAIPYAVIWLLLCKDLLTRDFGAGAPDAVDTGPATMQPA